MHRCEDLAEIALRKGVTISCAESCTGGLIGASITELPGSSTYFLGSAVTYSNDAKMSILGVEGSVLAEHGAVSDEVARQMALGACRLFSSDYSVAVTGIAGPGGATDTKPVGLVYIAVSDGSRCVSTCNVFAGDRSSVRSETVDQAIGLLTDMISGRL